MCIRDRYALGGSDALQVDAVAGGAYGEIWGTKYQRVEEGEFKGQLLLNESGLPPVSYTHLNPKLFLHASFLKRLQLPHPTIEYHLSKEHLEVFRSILFLE